MIIIKKFKPKVGLDSHVFSSERQTFRGHEAIEDRCAVYFSVAVTKFHYQKQLVEDCLGLWFQCVRVTKAEMVW